MLYTQLESELIATAQTWRESSEYECTISYDNTPFTDIGNGLKARTIKVNGAWMFKAIARQGYTGDTFYTLEETVQHALEEKTKHLLCLQERIKSRL